MSWLNNILGHIAPQNQKETEKKRNFKENGAYFMTNKKFLYCDDIFMTIKNV